MKKRLYELWRHVSDIITPRQCPVCGCRMTVDEATLCTRCNMRLPRTDHTADMQGNEMARLFWARLPIERAVALWLFQPNSQVSAMIYRMKYHHRPEPAVQLGCVAALELLPTGFFDGISAIVPVPLAKLKQRERGYNQSERIARGVALATHLPVLTDAVARIRETESQTRKTREERIENVDGAFALKRPDSVRGRHVLIVDDVVTTGSTVFACGKELAKAGGVSISVLSLCFSRT